MNNIGNFALFTIYIFSYGISLEKILQKMFSLLQIL